MDEPLSVTGSPVSFEGRADAGPDLLRSPVTGQPCVHWRLRIVEHLTARSALVHELASHEGFDLIWGPPASGSRDPGSGEAGAGEPGPKDHRSAVRIHIEPQAARIEATPTLHREGTPGALAAARAFGFSGAISVEEVVIRAGDDLMADGVLQDLTLGAGPFRAAAHGFELLDATVRLPARSLAPALLPWALGTVAALLGGMGLVTWAAWRYHARHLPAGHHAWRAGNVAHSPARLMPPELPHPRLP
jgi:hypothetical protein